MQGSRTGRPAKRSFSRPYLTDDKTGHEITIGDIVTFLGGVVQCKKLFNFYGVHCNEKTIYNWIEDNLVPPDAAEVLSELFKDQQEAPSVSFIFGGSSVVLTDVVDGKVVLEFSVPSGMALKINRRVSSEREALSTPHQPGVPLANGVEHLKNSVRKRTGSMKEGQNDE